MIAFVVSIALSLAFSAAITLALNGPLQAVLTEACETERRSKFWLAFANVMLFLTPLLFVLMFGGVSLPDSIPPEVLFLRQTFGAILGGLFLALLGVGFQISRLGPVQRAKTRDPRDENEFWGDERRDGT